MTKELPRVLFMRHPETLGNTQHFFSGRRDVPLSELGELQRQQAVQALVAWQPDRIVCSPLSRCRSIAEPAAEQLGVPCTVDERVVEIDFGEIEGVTTSQAAERGLSFPWPIKDGASVPCEGGESFEHLIGRARDFCAWAAGLEGKTACVTHGGFTRAVFAAVYGEDIDKFWYRVVPNVSSQVFIAKGGWLRLQTSGLSPEELEHRATYGFVPSDHTSTYIRTTEGD